MAIKETQLIIDLKALETNFKTIKSQIKPATQIMGVVKAFAYGTDSVVVAHKLVNLGVSYLAVAYTEEGVRLRKSGIQTPILVFYPQIEELSSLVEHHLVPSVYSFNFLIGLNSQLKDSTVIDFPIHLKINTGLNRLGFDLGELDEIYEEIKTSQHIKLAGVFSHLAASGRSSQVDFTKQQIVKYKQARTFFIEKFGQTFLSHLCNSSGIFNYPDAEFDMVRAGIALYGYGNNAIENEQLVPVSNLKTVIAQLRTIQKGESVGYERMFIAEKETVIASLPLGYIDGIARQFGNGKADVLINGEKAPIVGHVCMDIVMVDVTGINCQEGDQVIIFGREHSVLKFDKYQQTIPYEIITCISQRVTRVIEE